MITRIIFFLFAFFFLTSACYASEQENNNQNDDNITTNNSRVYLTITATRTKTKTEDLPASVSVVTKTEMEKRNLQHIDTAMNTEPGVFIRRTRGLMDTMNRISLRGFPGQSRTLVMLDGMPLNDAYSASYNLSGVALEELNSIEVVKGPFSSLYGGYAMGGAVNLLTKMPKKREFVFKTGYGTGFERGEAMDDLRRTYISYGDKVGNLSVIMSYNRQDTNGYPANLNVQTAKPPENLTGWQETTDNKGNTKYLIGDKGDNRWFNDSFSMRGEYKFSYDTKAGVSYIRNRREMNYDPGHSFLEDINGDSVYTYKSGKSTVYEGSFLAANNGDTQNIITGNYETRINDIGIKLLAGFQNREENYSVSPDSTKADLDGGKGKISDSPNKNYYTDIQFNKEIFDKHLITLGGTYRRGEIDSNEFYMSDWKRDDVRGYKTYTSQGKDSIYSIFLQDEYRFSDKIILFLGLRHDTWETSDGYVNQINTKGYPVNYESREDTALSPKATIVYKPFEGTKLNASAGKAFRPPTLYDLYRTWTTSSGITYAGNPSLSPETSTSWEVGLEQKLWKGASFKATYFEDYVEDLIYTKNITSTYKERINAGKADKYGVELELEQWLNDNLKVFGNFTYNYGIITENEAAPESEGELLTDMPVRMFNAGAFYIRGPLSASLIGRYVGDQYGEDDNSDVVNNVHGSYDPYFVLDAKISYKILDRYTISVSADNILDREYYAYYKAQGASWFAEVGFKY